MSCGTKTDNRNRNSHNRKDDQELRRTRLDDQREAERTGDRERKAHNRDDPEVKRVVVAGLGNLAERSPVDLTHPITLVRQLVPRRHSPERFLEAAICQTRAREETLDLRAPQLGRNSETPTGTPRSGYRQPVLLTVL
jgi:hypothetical protein